MWEYTEKVREHFLDPKNSGEIENPDGFGEVGNISCGDALRLTFKLDDSKKIADAKFKTFGCGSAIASASMLTELIKGKTVEEAEAVSNKEIAEALGGLPKEKMHCSVMGQEALEAAITYYRNGGKVKEPEKKKEGVIICTCFNTTDKEIEKAIMENNLKTIEDVTNYTKAGGGCAGCHPQIQEILDRIHGASAEPNTQPSKRLSLVQKIDRIRTVIENDVKPVLEKDGGSCELVDIDGNVVYVRLKGHCASCALSNYTLTSLVERSLKDKVAPELMVKEAD